MNPQTIILGFELAQKVVNALQLIHQQPHPKSVHDEVSNIIHAIFQAAKPEVQPESPDTKGE